MKQRLLGEEGRETKDKSVDIEVCPSLICGNNRDGGRMCMSSS